MRKVFIDGGANMGQSIEAFCNHYPHAEEFEIHSFEPSNSHFDIVKPLNRVAEEYRNKVKGIEIHNKAIWIHDGTIDFYDAGTESSSILYRTGMIKNPTVTKREVDCVDMGNWIKNSFTKEDHIVLKLDIEGAEYDVIPKMFEDGALEYIDRFFCEIHGIKCHYTFDQSMSLINIANEATGGLYIWSAESYGTRKETKYDEEILKREYKKWHINDIECCYLRGDMDHIDDLPEHEVIQMVEIMINNGIWKAKIKGTRYIVDLSDARTTIGVLG
jgi:FkbM family methyltransferase